MFRLAMSHIQAIWTYCFDQSYYRIAVWDPVAS
jgi:hypothetical protein